MLTRKSLNGMWAGPPVPWTCDDRFAQRLGADAIQVALKHTPALLRLN